MKARLDRLLVERGLAESRRMAEQECARAHQVLSLFGERARRLHELADLIVHRKS